MQHCTMPDTHPLVFTLIAEVPTAMETSNTDSTGQPQSFKLQCQGVKGSVRLVTEEAWQVCK